MYNQQLYNSSAIDIMFMVSVDYYYSGCLVGFWNLGLKNLLEPTTLDHGFQLGADDLSAIVIKR